MGLVSLLFSFKGRVNRQQYWFGSMGVGFAGAMLIFAVLMMAAPLPGSKDAAAPAAFFLLIPITLAMGWAGIAIQWKRFHDRSQPGWISLLPLVLAWNMMSTIVGGIMGHQPMVELATAVEGHMLFVWIVNFAFFINLGCLAGTDGSNKYGDPPGPWGRDAERAPPSRPSAPAAASAKATAMPSFLSASSLAGAASAIDRAIAEGPRVMEPATVPLSARAAVAAAPASSGFGRASTSSGFGKKR